MVNITAFPIHSKFHWNRRTVSQIFYACSAKCLRAELWLLISSLPIDLKKTTRLSLLQGGRILLHFWIFILVHTIFLVHPVSSVT